MIEPKIPSGLIDAILAKNPWRHVAHCGVTKRISTFDIYYECDVCGEEIKVRSMSGVEDIDDVFDAVFQWALDPDAAKVMAARQAEIRDDID
jgi:hypothetical protein